MVSGGGGCASSVGASDLEISDHSDFLDYLIDDFIKRKDRLKVDRQNDRDTPDTSTNSRHGYSYKPYIYVDDRKDGSLNRPRHRVTHVESNTNKNIEPNRPLSFSQFPHCESQMYQSSNVYPILIGSQSRDILNSNCDHLPALCDSGAVVSVPPTSLDDCTGNNSEDEYYFGEQCSGNIARQNDNLERLLMEKKGWKIIKVASDGACLFRSVSHQIFGDESKNDLIRSQVIDYMVKNKEHFSQYLTEDFDHYISRKRHESCHGNHVEIQAIAELYNRPVEIYYDSVEPINVFHADYSKETPIRLSYHGRVHYNSIVDPFNPTFGHGLGMPNYQPGLAEPDLIVRALRESEATDLEEAMLRDKLAETDHREIEQVIENQVVRDSYYEYLSQITLPVSNVLSQDTSITPTQDTALKFMSDKTKSHGATSSKFHTLDSGPSICLDSTEISPSASSSSQQTASDFLKNIPHVMFGMDDDALVAMVMEKSRLEYFETLRTKHDKSEKDTSGGIRNAFHGLKFQNSVSSENTQNTDGV